MGLEIRGGNSDASRTTGVQPFGEGFTAPSVTSRRIEPMTNPFGEEKDTLPKDSAEYTRQSHETPVLDIHFESSGKGGGEIPPFREYGEGEEPEIIKKAVQSAKGSTVITSELSPSALVTYSNGTFHPPAGLVPFGDGITYTELPRRSFNLKNIPKGMIVDSCEAITFIHATEFYKADSKKVTKKSPGIRGMLGQKTSEELPIRKERPLFVINPFTGEEEEAMSVEYVFDNAMLNIHPAEVSRELKTALSRYRDPVSDRPGKSLTIQTLLPMSIGQELQTQTEQQPKLARVYAKIIAEGNCAWYAIKPPYELLPDNWKINIIRSTEDPEAQGNFYEWKKLNIS